MTDSWAAYAELARTWAAEDRRLAAWFDALLAGERDERRQAMRRLDRASRRSSHASRRTKRHGAPRGHYRKRVRR